MKRLEIKESKALATSFGLINIKRLTMSDSVAEVLRTNIINGTLQSGTRVAEDWVSREMKISRGPVREALRQLESEGLIVVVPYRGAVVNEITADELREVLIPLRYILESESALRAMKVMTDQDFNYLGQVVQEMRIAAISKEPNRLLTLVNLDVRFHEFLTERGNSYHTLHIWRMIQSRIRAGFYRLGPRHLDYHEIPEEHHILLEAIKTKNPKTAREALRTHICTSNLALLKIEAEAKRKQSGSKAEAKRKQSGSKAIPKTVAKTKSRSALRH